MAEPSEVDSIPLIRSSERGLFKSCMQAWEWAYVRCLIPSVKKLDARDEGTGHHLAMAEYYIPGKKRGRPLVETWTEWCDSEEKEMRRRHKTMSDGVAIREEVKEFEEMRARGIFLMKEYMKKYGEVVFNEEENEQQIVADPDWEVICVEETFAVNLAGKAINVGTIDLVVRNVKTREIWIMDHKTAKGFPIEAKYILDDQGGSYSATATHVLRKKELIGPNERVKGIIFNIIRKGNPDDRPRNADGLYCNKPTKDSYLEAFEQEFELDADERKRLKKMTVANLAVEAEAEGLTVLGEPSKVQPAPYFKRVPIERTKSQQLHQLGRVVDDVTMMQKARRKEIPILKSPGNLCPFCDFFQLCQLDESRGDTEGMIELMFKTRDPYHDHREGATNSKKSVQADANLKH